MRKDQANPALLKETPTYVTLAQGIQCNPTARTLILPPCFCACSCQLWTPGSPPRTSSCFFCLTWTLAFLFIHLFIHIQGHLGAGNTLVRQMRQSKIKISCSLVKEKDNPQINEIAAMMSTTNRCVGPQAPQWRDLTEERGESHV